MGTKYKGNKKEIDALNAFININRAVESVSSRLSKNHLDNGLTESQFGVLEALLHLGPLCQKEIAEKLLVSGGNITMVIDNLEKRDLVMRVRSEKDRRYYNIELTSKGENLIKGIFPVHVKAIVKEFEVLTSKEQELLRGLSRKLGMGKKPDHKGVSKND
ncbi:MAG: MarR family winged helix-turn-helix transcriptional regulator [Thermodesulfobacteriota bacterium]